MTPTRLAVPEMSGKVYTPKLQTLLFSYTYLYLGYRPTPMNHNNLVVRRGGKVVHSKTPGMKRDLGPNRPKMAAERGNS